MQPDDPRGLAGVEVTAYRIADLLVQVDGAVGLGEDGGTERPSGDPPSGASSTRKITSGSPALLSGVIVMPPA